MKKASDNQILITISSLNEFMEHTRKAFKRVEAGLPPELPINRMSFIDEATFLKNLTAKRMELIKFLKKSEPLSCRQLSIQLKRAYANVHEDVKVLLSLKLIKKNSEQKLFVPWDEITISIKLAA